MHSVAGVNSLVFLYELPVNMNVNRELNTVICALIVLCILYWLCLEYGNRYCDFGHYSTWRPPLQYGSPVHTRNPNPNSNPKLTLTLNTIHTWSSGAHVCKANLDEYKFCSSLLFSDSLLNVILDCIELQTIQILQIILNFVYKMAAMLDDVQFLCMCRCITVNI